MCVPVSETLNAEKRWEEEKNINVIYNATVEDGSAVIVVPDLPSGSYSLNVSYSGDEMYKAYNATVTFNVNKLITAPPSVLIIYSSIAHLLLNFK